MCQSVKNDELQALGSHDISCDVNIMFMDNSYCKKSLKSIFESTLVPFRLPVMSSGSVLQIIMWRTLCEAALRKTSSHPRNIQ